MRIRSIALGFVVALGAFAVTSAVVVWSGSWSRLSEISEAETLISTLRPTTRFTEVLALERGVYNQVLVSKDAGAAESERLVAERVLVTDRLFDEAISRSSLLSSPMKEQFVGALNDAWAIIRAARAEANPIWRDPSRTSTDAAVALVARYMDAASRLEQGQASAYRVLTTVDPNLGMLLEISRLSNDLRELAGQRGTLLSRYVGSLKQFEVAERVRVSELSGAIRITWQRMQRLSMLVDSPPVERAISRMRSEFFGKAEPIYVRAADAARDGTKPPLDFLAWRKWTVEMLGVTLAARDVPLEQAIADIGRLREKAINVFLVALARVVGALLLFMGAGWLVEIKVVRPIGKLTEVLDLLTGARSGHTASSDVADLSARFGMRNDEIGSLARAIGRFQRHAIELEKLNQRFNAVLANLPQGVCFYDDNHVLVVSNRRYADLYGVDPRSVCPGLPLQAVLNLRESALGRPVEDGDCYVAEALATASPGEMAHRIIELPNGRIITVNGLRVPGGGWLATHLDVTERTHAEAQITHMANHDALTGLPNRSFFAQEMERALKRVQRGGELAVMFLDLDRFKAVNDTLGHACGDELLKQVTFRIKQCVRDSEVVARLGGDEFAIMFNDRAGVNLSGIAQRIIDSVSRPYQIDEHEAVIGTSIGVAIGPQDGNDPQELLKAADMALYRAKTDGRGTYRFFEPDMDARMRERRLLELDLRKALVQGEFELHYQPIVDVSTDTVTCFEALVRWNHPTRGRVSPADFIPRAEETGLIIDLGAWVLREACGEAITWPKAIKVAVNLSPRQFVGTRLLSDVVSALRDTGLPAHRLELEITEQLMLSNSEANMKVLHRLRELGVRISMDDFGTGYSSLSYLRRFPFDKIKIDQSFIRDLTPNTDSHHIVRAIIELGAGLRMKTTAEGVETEAQLEALRAEGCTEVQGYFFSRPIPGKEIPALLGRFDHGRAAA